jgi:hypothetical protein
VKQPVKDAQEEQEVQLSLLAQKEQVVQLSLCRPLVQEYQ